MKYSEAKSRIKDFLESKYGDEWSDYYRIEYHYRIEAWKVIFGLSRRAENSESFEPVLRVSEEDPGSFKVCKLGRSEKPLADIFMELALTPLEEREEEKKYVVKVWDTWAISIILVKDRSGLFNIMTSDVVDIFNQDGGSSYQVAFTKKEIDLLKDNATLNIDWDKAVEEYDGEI